MTRSDGRSRIGREKVGETECHYLVLSALVGGVAVPLYWSQLGKLGASSQEERKEMFEKALSLFDLKGMRLLADREQVGREWFKFLKDNGIHFVIRMRLGDYEAEVSASGGKAYYKMYLKCAVKDKLIKKRVWLERQAYTIVTMPNPKALAEKPVPIFLTTLPDAKKAAEPYVKRWKIECLFKHLKTNGYNIEDINLKDQGKSLLMFAIAATAYILAFGEGHKRQKDIPTHRYADGAESPEVSIFREGLAWITPKCYRFVEFLKYLFKAMKPEYHPILQNVQ